MKPEQKSASLKRAGTKLGEWKLSVTVSVTLCAAYIQAQREPGLKTTEKHQI